MGISGACRKQELRNLNPTDVEDTGKSLIVHIRESKTKTQRSFVVSETFYPLCKHYMNLRPPNEQCKNLPFFLNYANKKCTKQCVGINKFGSVPQKVAEFLGLENAKQYTGHCFRRSSATILANAGGDMFALKKLGGWGKRSDAVVQGYIDNSMESQIANSSKITNAINNSAVTNATTLPSTITTSTSHSAMADSTNSISHYTINNSTTTSTMSHSAMAHTSNSISKPSHVFNNCNVTINNHYN